MRKQAEISIQGGWLLRPSGKNCLLALASAIALAIAVDALAGPSESVLASFGLGNAGRQPLAAPVMDANGNLYGTTSRGGAYDKGGVGGAYGGTVYKVAPDGTETILWNFGNGTDGQGPSNLVIDSSGNLYGTTGGGGAYGGGTVFKLTPQGAESILWSFGNGADGAFPGGGLVMDTSGNLYGTTTSGGASNNGTVFEVTPQGTETVLWRFGGGASDGQNPEAGLFIDANNNLYGTTRNGGNYGKGTVFEVTPQGIESILLSFDGDDGEYSSTPVILDAAGNIYGETFQGGAFGFGTVFKLTPQGAESTLWSFNGTDGGFPFFGGLVMDASGNLYGTGWGVGIGGDYGAGVVFKLTPQGNESVLWSFGNGSDGSEPVGLIIDASGNLAGTTESGGVNQAGTVFTLTAQGVESVLYSFGSPPVGANPQAGLVRDATGNLYGTTTLGGSQGPSAGGGTAFELTASGTLSTIWNFGAGTDGQNPHSDLIIDKSGNLYGTTATGGANSIPSIGYGGGTVFELTAPGSAGESWSESILWSFPAAVYPLPSPADGMTPEAGLLMDQSGNLYGTTAFGGAYGTFDKYGLEPASGGGTVFELSPPSSSSGGTWTEKVLWSFGNGTDGNEPFSSLIFDSGGDLYGTTEVGGLYGGTSNDGVPANQGGTAFKLAPPSSGGSSWTESVLWNFGNGADGQIPYAGLTMDNIGDLFGTASSGGTYGSGGGTAYELSPPPRGSSKWIESILWSFGSGVDGATPLAKLLRDSSGKLYGTTEFGGSNVSSGGETGQGTVFKLAPPLPGQNLWSESILWDFGGAGDGIAPFSDLITDGNGNLFGTTNEGGANASSGGTVFEIADAIATGGQIYVKPRLIRFPATAIGSTSTVAIGIRNTGRGQLSGTVSPPFAPFGISGSGSFTLAPRTETTITMTFTPASSTRVRQLDTLTSNSIRNSTVQIGLEGTGSK